MARRLISTRREITPGGQAAYDAAWSSLAQHARAGGAHAWRFVSAAYPIQYLEFLEFATDADPRSGEAIAAALAEMDLIAEGAVEEWDEKP